MRDSGSGASLMAKERSNMQTATYILANGRMESAMDWADMRMLADQSMLASLKTTCVMALELVSGPMADSTLVCGKLASAMDKAKLRGPMETATQASM